MFQERYHLLIAAGGRHDGRASITWSEVGRTPLCLLTPDMQNRRIIDQQLRASGSAHAPTLASNSMIVLMSHVRTRHWASVMPTALADALGPMPGVRTIPIVEPEIEQTIGLVVPPREPATPMVAALVGIGRQLARTPGGKPAASEPSRACAVDARRKTSSTEASCLVKALY